MRAGSHEVQIPVVGVPVGGPEVGHLGQPMGQAVGGAFRQVISFGPRGRGNRLFELQVRFEVGDAEALQPAKNLLARPSPKRVPILFPVFVQVTDRDDRRQGILSGRGQGGIEPGGGVEVQAGIVGQAQVPIDALEVLPVIVRQEKRLRDNTLTIPSWGSRS